MPIETAVAAIMSEIASATVAINSMPALRRRDIVRPVIRGAKPGLPVSSAIVVFLVAIFGQRRVWNWRANRFGVVARSRANPAPVRPDFGEAIEEQRPFRGFG
jgi:hypothetical protein